MAVELPERPVRSLQGLAVGLLFALATSPGCRTSELDPSDPVLSEHLEEHVALLEAAARDREALLRHQRAAEEGDPASQSALGLMYLLGRGLPRHDRAAAMWFRRSALQGDPAGQYHLGLLFLEGRGVPRSIELAATWLRRAKDQDDGRARRSFDALYGAVTELPDEVAGAATWFRRTAEGGLPYAQLALAKLNLLEWQSHRGVPAGERSQTIEWLRRAAEQGYPDAQLELGLILADLGADEEAVVWLTAAAQAGLPAAQRELGLAYIAGRGVGTDLVQAHAWLNLSAASGDAVAAEEREAVRARLSRREVEEAQRLALEWHERVIARSLETPPATDAQ